MHKDPFPPIRKIPKVFLALNRIGVAYAEKRDRHRAIEFLKKAYRLSPRDINTNSHLASIYKSIGKYGAAMMHAANIYRLEGSDSNLNRIKELHKLIIENHSDELLAKKIQQ
ncbi:hypothetical protein CAQ69_04750 [Stutzerimonas stutzeri]|nr:hypothetical protein CAQ69_04750 [Stutzerimonas stutzeri]